MKKLIGILTIFSLCFTGCNSGAFCKTKERKTEIYSIENNEEIFEESINNDMAMHFSIFYPNLEDSLPDSLVPERKLYVYQKRIFLKKNMN